MLATTTRLSFLLADLSVSRVPDGQKPITFGVIAAGLNRLRIDINTMAFAAPSFSAAIARMPEPQPSR